MQRQETYQSIPIVILFFTLIGIIILGEAMDVLSIVGILLILLGAYVNYLSKKNNPSWVIFYIFHLIFQAYPLSLSLNHT